MGHQEVGGDAQKWNRMTKTGMSTKNWHLSNKNGGNMWYNTFWIFLGIASFPGFQDLDNNFLVVTWDDFYREIIHIDHGIKWRYSPVSSNMASWDIPELNGHLNNASQGPKGRGKIRSAYRGFPIGSSSWRTPR